MPELTPAEDERQIRHLVALWTDTIVRYDYDGFRALWTPDAVWEISEPLPSRAEGVEAIDALLRRLMGQFEFFVQMIHTGVITVDGDTATARWVVEEIGRNPEKTFNYNNYGIYDDILVRGATGWQFTNRFYNYVWVDTQTPVPGESYRYRGRVDLL